MLPCPAAVGRAQPRQRKRREGRVLRQNCLAVFDAQNVVGGAQQSPCAGAQGVGGLGSGGGVGHAGCKIFAYHIVNFFTLQQPGRVQQRPRVGRLGPKSQCVTPEGGQQIHSRGGELLRRGAGVGRGQGNDDIRPGSQRCLHPHPLGQNRHAAALHRAAAHADSNALGTCRPHRRDLGRVAVVEGVIFGDNACEIHNDFLLNLWR